MCIKLIALNAVVGPSSQDNVACDGHRYIHTMLCCTILTELLNVFGQTSCTAMYFMIKCKGCLDNLYPGPGKQMFFHRLYEIVTCCILRE